jgi:hypothetical protein
VYCSIIVVCYVSWSGEEKFAFKEERLGRTKFEYVIGYVKRKLQFVCVMKLIKQYNLGGYTVGSTDKTALWSTLLRWPQVARYTYIPLPVTIGPGIQIILRETYQQIWELVVLVLLTRGIYDVHHWSGLRWYDIHTKFHSFIKIGSGIRKLIVEIHIHTHRQKCDLMWRQ